ncbi:phosphonate C-P lyase system protein PhnH [Rhizobium jaguaris]|uniref:phosphonate C-P lyase system protein PhnH n=1 Tax=Rhizobium jaguaris TaxID=1312183 RepID=UPI0039BF3954
MSVAIDTRNLKPGFAEPIFDAQATFRGILDATAYPGRVQALDRLADVPDLLMPATAAIVLTLLDFETPVWLDLENTSAAANYIRFHAGSPLVSDTAICRFAILTTASEMPPLSAFSFGDDKYPDTSCTLIVQAPSLTSGKPMRWTGPGIQHATTCSIDGLPDGFWQDWDDNHGLYPMGVDVIFVSGSDIIGLPRGIRVEA